MVFIEIGKFILNYIAPILILAVIIAMIFVIVSIFKEKRYIGGIILTILEIFLILVFLAYIEAKLINL